MPASCEIGVNYFDNHPLFRRFLNAVYACTQSRK
jgi:hypothetical protein